MIYDSKQIRKIASRNFILKMENCSINAKNTQEIAIKAEFPAEEQYVQVKKEEMVPDGSDYKFKCETSDVKDDLDATIKLEPLVTEELDMKNDSVGTLPVVLEQSNFLQRPQYKCINCNYETTVKRKLQQHTITHQRGKIYHCNHCDYKCIRKDYLRMHLIGHTRRNPQTCKLCNYRTTYNYRMQRHMITHIDVKPFKCSVCNYRTAYKRNLKTHEKNHTLGKLLKCNICDYRTSVKHNFEMHIPTHNVVITPKDDTLSQDKRLFEKHKQGGIFFKCKDCGYRTVKKSNMELHIARHGKTSFFRCDKCYYKTAYKHNLQRHKKNHGSDKLFQCTICKYKTTVKWNFEMHLPTHNVCYQPLSKPVKISKQSRKNLAKSSNVFKCDRCDYRTIVKRNFEMHLPTHLEQSTNNDMKMKQNFQQQEYTTDQHNFIIPSTSSIRADPSANVNQGFLVLDSQQMLNLGYYCQIQNLGVINSLGYYQ